METKFFYIIVLIWSLQPKSWNSLIKTIIGVIRYILLGLSRNYQRDDSVYNQLVPPILEEKTQDSRFREDSQEIDVL